MAGKHAWWQGHEEAACHMTSSNSEKREMMIACIFLFLFSLGPYPKGWC